MNINNLQSQIASLADAIKTQFLANAGDLKPSPAEDGLITESTQTLAETAILAINATPATQAALAIRRNAALATLANIGVAEGINAAQVVQQTIQTVVGDVFQIALEFLLTAAK